MPQPNSPAGQTSTAANPTITTSGDSSSQAYGRTRTGSDSQTRDDRMSKGAADVMGHAKDTISDVASQAGGKVTQQLDTQRDRAASSLGSVAQALRQTSDQIRDQNDNAGLPVHQYVASVADQVERFSGYLRSTDVRRMMGDFEQFAKRQPGLFLGGAFLLGLLGARFLKSSGENTYTGGRSLSGSGGYTGSDDYAGRRPYDTTQQTGYTNQYSSGGSSQYGSSGQGSSGQYLQGGSAGYGQAGYRSGESPAQQGSTTPTNTSGKSTGEI